MNCIYGITYTLCAMYELYGIELNYSWAYIIYMYDAYDCILKCIHEWCMWIALSIRFSKAWDGPYYFWHAKSML